MEYYVLFFSMADKSAAVSVRKYGLLFRDVPEFQRLPNAPGDVTNSTRISNEDKAKILGGNMVRSLKLDSFPTGQVLRQRGASAPLLYV